MDDTFEAALTPAMWAEVRKGGVDWDDYALGRLQLGALALDGQPFGFTWEDVDGLRALAASLEETIGNPASVAPLRDLAGRIEALLAPRAG